MTARPVAVAVELSWPAVVVVRRPSRIIARTHVVPIVRKLEPGTSSVPKIGVTPLRLEDTLLSHADSNGQ
jgi:hypothetical protein